MDWFCQISKFWLVLFFIESKNVSIRNYSCWSTCTFTSSQRSSFSAVASYVTDIVLGIHNSVTSVVNTTIFVAINKILSWYCYDLFIVSDANSTRSCEFWRQHRNAFLYFILEQWFISIHFHLRRLIENNNKTFYQKFYITYT